MSKASMEVPEDILQLLKCSKCKGLLSRGPVFQCPDGGSLCSACHLAAPVPATRNTIYEAVASLLLFPCRHQEEGCKEKVPFTDSAVHEGECSFQEYVCPMHGSPACNWSGSATRFLEHCQQQHPCRVVSSPVTLTHDIDKFNTDTYLLQAFNVLFLLFTKVCVTSGNIYYTIRYLGNSIEAVNFKFKLNITRNEETLTKNGQVLPKGCLAIEEDSSLVININSLLQILGGFSNTTFTVTLQRLLGEMETCIKCNILMSVKVYRDSEGWKCKFCAPSKIKCTNSLDISNDCMTCSYMVFENKFSKHAKYFCNYAECNICSTNVYYRVLLHYEQKHLTGSSKSSWRVERGINNKLLFKTEAGIAVCVYIWQKTNLKLLIYTPLSSDELSKFRCSMKVTQVATGDIRTYSPDELYDKTEDWVVEVTNKDFSVWTDTYDICFSVKKI